MSGGSVPCMEVHFRHLMEKKLGLLSQYNEILIQNIEILSQHIEILSQNNEILSQK